MKKSDKKIIFILFLITLLFYSPLLNGITKHFENEDWYQFESYNANAKEAYYSGKIPFWTPFFGGGFPIYSHPEDQSLTPLIIPTLIFGEVIGVKITTLILLMIGSISLYLFLREGYTKKAAFFGAILFSLSSYFPNQLADGNFSFEILWNLIPLILYLISKRKLFWAALTASILFLSGAFVTIFGFLFMTIFFMFYKKEYIPKIILIFFLAILIASPKIIPMSQLLTSHTRCIDDYQDNNFNCVESTQKFLTISELKKDLFTPKRHSLSAAYISILIFIPFIYGLKKKKKLIIPLLIFMFLILGSTLTFNLYFLLGKLPFFSQVINIPKYMIPPILLTITLISARGIDNISKLNHKISVLLITLITTLLFLTNITLHTGLFTEKIIFNNETTIQKEIQKQPLIQELIQEKIITKTRNIVPVAKWQYINIKNKKGSINWYSGIIIKENTIPDYFITLSGNKTLNPDRLKTKNITYTHNKITLNNLKTDSILINQNYHKSWTTNCGKLSEKNGLLYLENTSNCKTVKLKFIPISFYIGGIISIITIIITWTQFQSSSPPTMKKKILRNL